MLSHGWKHTCRQYHQVLVIELEYQMIDVCTSSVDVSI